jgi:hypothetical protein
VGGEPSSEKDDSLRVEFRYGKITLHGELRADWLERYGGDEQALNDGLMQAAGYIQPEGPRSLEVEVNAQLARQFNDRRDRAKNHQRAVESNRRANAPIAKQPAHVRGSSGVADTGAIYEEPRSYSLDSPEGRAWMAELQREGDEAGIARVEKLGRVRLRPSEARRLVSGEGGGAQSLGGTAAAIVAARRPAQGAMP